MTKGYKKKKQGEYRQYIRNKPAMLICYIVSLKVKEEKEKICRRAPNKLNTKEHLPGLQKQRTYSPLPVPGLSIKRLDNILRPILPNYSIRRACNLFPIFFPPSLASIGVQIRACLGSSPVLVLGPCLHRILS